MPPTAPAPGKTPPGATGAALAGARDAASRLPASRRSGGHRRQRWRHRARRRLRTARPGQHRTAGALAPGRRLRAAADVTGAAVLLAGLPWGLGRLAGPPLPGHWPGWQQVREFLASPLSGGTAITVLAGAAWLLWAVFAVAVIAEVTAAACGRPVPRLPAIAPVQALAATLAGTVVITALHLPRTAARAAQPPHAVLTATVTTAGPVLPGGGDGLPDIAGRFPGNAGDRPRISWLDAARAAGTSGRTRPDDRVHTVVAGDNLWDLARTYLGSGERWHEIYDLNRGRPQPGGGTLTDPARIYPGWDLLIPAAGPHPQHGRPNPPGAGRPARHPREPPPAAGGSPGPARSPHPARSTPATGQPGARQHVPPAGVRLPSGALIGLGTAVVVSTAVALARIHRRRRYRPGTVLTSSLEPPCRRPRSSPPWTARPAPPPPGHPRQTAPARTTPSRTWTCTSHTSSPSPAPANPGGPPLPRRPASRPRSRQASRAPSRPRPARSPSASAAARRSPPTPPPSAASA